MKQLWWWCTDPAWRKQFTANKRRIRDFRIKQGRAVKKLIHSHHGRILAGPFAGMLFTPALRRGACCAQVLQGTYELELREIIETICESAYARVVVLGAAQGYYLCGFKFRMPMCRAVGFELDESKHANILAFAAQNGITEGIVVRGRCDVSALQRELAGEERPLVVCDVDGAESELLDPVSVPELVGSDVLVETHDSIVEGVTQEMISRFERTHEVKMIGTRERTSADAPEGSPLSPDEAKEAMDEFRGCQQFWLWMTSRKCLAKERA